ncbi:MAG: hypothetical protein HN548_02230 [Opitutae bacterium]|jgi:hypothetical protein|nr:hypothetical protein [Opitutae bacterium]
MRAKLDMFFVFIDLVVFAFFFLWQKTSNRKFLILCDTYGNIGNQLYLSCFLIKWSEEFNLLTFNFGLIRNQHYFVKAKEDLLLRYPASKSFHAKNLQLQLAACMHRISLRLLKLKEAQGIQSIDLLEIKSESDFASLEAKIERNGLTFLRGFIHNKPYSIFRNHLPKIREYFEIAKSYDAQVMEPIEHLKCCDLIIGVAIRHGDYKTWQNGKFFLPTETYQKWMEEIEELFASSKVGFFIASDEEQDLTTFKKHTFFFRAGHPLSNLYSLSKCDFLVSVPSSFAGWAHFIGEVPYLAIDKKVRKVTAHDFKSW